MSVDSKTVLKFAWILASLGCFIIPLLFIPFEGWQSWFRHVSRDMGAGMIVLTFPLGVFYLLAVVILAEIILPFQPPVSFYVLLWVGFFGTGYLQWFHLLPYLLNKKYSTTNQSLTTLGLDNTKPNGKRSRRRSRRLRSKRLAPAQLEQKRVLPFNEMRSTPLERVIGDS